MQEEYEQRILASENGKNMDNQNQRFLEQQNKELQEYSNQLGAAIQERDEYIKNVQDTLRQLEEEKRESELFAEEI